MGWSKRRNGDHSVGVTSEPRVSFRHQADISLGMYAMLCQQKQGEVGTTYRALYIYKTKPIKLVGVGRIGIAQFHPQERYERGMSGA
jgi:hypothetical protein